MTKKTYLKPAIEAKGFDMNEQMLANSVQTTGLDNVDLDLDGSGDSWNDAMSRRKAWSDGEEW